MRKQLLVRERILTTLDALAGGEEETLLPCPPHGLDLRRAGLSQPHARHFLESLSCGPG